MSQYNLIDEKWIPVIDLSGNRKQLGIKDVLLQAENLARIEDPSPLVTAALHRFLLAVLYRALEGPCDIDEAKQYFREGLPKEKINQYLEKWRPRFWLFDEKYPFGQNPNIPNEEIEPWTKLTSEYNSTSSKVLFDHTDINNLFVPSNDSIAKWIITTMNFSVRGGRGYSPSPSSNARFVIPIGNSVNYTLLFCLHPYPNKEVAVMDLPLWEQDIQSYDYYKRKLERISKGYADRYTWQSRIMKLISDSKGKVKKVAFMSGIRHLDSPTTEAMIPYISHPTKGVIVMPLEDKGMWRDFDSLVPNGTGHSPKIMDNVCTLCGRNRTLMPKKFLILGQSFSNAKIVFWRMEEFTLPAKLFESVEVYHDIKSLLLKAEDVSEYLNLACRETGKMILTHGERSLEVGDLTKYVINIGTLPYYWSTLEPKFHVVLHNYAIDKNPEEINHDWLISIRDSLSKAWILVQKSIAGGDAWAIRALVKGEDIIAKKISELNQDIQKLKEVL